MIVRVVFYETLLGDKLKRSKFNFSSIKVIVDSYCGFVDLIGTRNLPRTEHVTQASVAIMFFKLAVSPLD
jgi:hypothetical protein